MISKFWSRQGQHGWREEHGLIVRMRNEKTYALVVQGRKGRCERGPGGGKGPENGEDEWRDKGKHKPGGIDRHGGEVLERRGCKEMRRCCGLQNEARGSSLLLANHRIGVARPKARQED